MKILIKKVHGAKRDAEFDYGNKNQQIKWGYFGRQLDFH